MFAIKEYHSQHIFDEIARYSKNQEKLCLVLGLDLHLYNEDVNAMAFTTYKRPAEIMAVHFGNQNGVLEGFEDRE